MGRIKRACFDHGTQDFSLDYSLEDRKHYRLISILLDFQPAAVELTQNEPLVTVPVNNPLTPEWTPNFGK